MMIVETNKGRYTLFTYKSKSTGIVAVKDDWDIYYLTETDKKTEFPIIRLSEIIDDNQKNIIAELVKKGWLEIVDGVHSVGKLKNELYSYAGGDGYGSI